MLIDSLLIFKGFFGFVIFFFCIIFVIKGVGRGGEGGGWGFCPGVLRACSWFYGHPKENNIWHKMKYRTRNNALMQTKLLFFISIAFIMATTSLLSN